MQGKMYTDEFKVLYGCLILVPIFCLTFWGQFIGGEVLLYEFNNYFLR